MNTLKINTIITAGGASTRFGSNKLLEYMPNENRVVEETVKKFIPYSDKIIIPCRDDIEKCIKNSDFYKDNSNKFIFVKNGSTRQESVYNALMCCKNPDYVLIHDGARPYISDEVIKKTIETVIEKDAVCVGVYAVDTIKITDSQKRIIKTLDRKTVFQAQTPQAFKFDIIKDIHKNLCGMEFTDDSSMAEYSGICVYALEGSFTNKKITTKEDLN